MREKGEKGERETKKGEGDKRKTRPVSLPTQSY